MAIKLKESETKKIEADLHWSTYLIPGIWAGFLSLSILAQIFLVKSADPGPSKSTALFWSFIIGYLPISYRFLQNKCKHYVVTSERLFVEEGILSKKKKDIPLQKINDLEVTQNLIERLLGSGSVAVLTGNDKPTVLSDIDSPDDFKNALSEAVSIVLTKKV